MDAGFATRALAALLVASVLAGCGGGADDTGTDAGTQEDAAGSAAAATVFDPLTSAPSRVEQRLDAGRDGHTRALDAAIEASEGVAAGSAAQD